MLFGSLHMRLVMLLQVVVIRSDNQQFQQYFMHSRSIHTINLSECVAKRLITRVDEACLSLSLSLLVYANVCLAFSSFSFFSSFFFILQTIFVLHVWTRLLASEERKRGRGKAVLTATKRTRA